MWSLARQAITRGLSPTHDCRSVFGYSLSFFVNIIANRRAKLHILPLFYDRQRSLLNVSCATLSAASSSLEHDALPRAVHDAAEVVELFSVNKRVPQRHPEQVWRHQLRSDVLRLRTTVRGEGDRDGEYLRAHDV